MISASRDGEFVAFVAKRLGFTPARGSVHKGGAQAIDELAVLISSGHFPAFAVDGPKGPRRIAKSGIVDLARRTQLTIVPLTAVADRYWVFRKSWDQFRLPKPFARIVVCYGSPITVPPGARGSEFGPYKRQVTDALNDAEIAAFTHLGKSVEQLAALHRQSP